MTATSKGGIIAHWDHDDAANWNAGANGGQAWKTLAGSARDSFSAGARDFPPGQYASGAISPAISSACTLVLLGYSAQVNANNQYLLSLGSAAGTGVHLLGQLNGDIYVCKNGGAQCFPSQGLSSLSNAMMTLRWSAAAFDGNPANEYDYWVGPTMLAHANPAGGVTLNAIHLCCDYSGANGSAATLREAMVFNRALPELEIQALYEQRGRG
jgi:hypothetical protein